MKPKLDTCSICNHEFVISKRDGDKKICMSCYMWEQIQKNKETTKNVDIDMGNNSK